MAPKARSLTSAVARASWLLLFVAGCGAESSGRSPELEPVDITNIPADTVDAGSPGLAAVNGVYSLNDQPFSGFVRESYTDHNLKRVASYHEGTRHGLTTTFFPNGRVRDVRSYRDNVGYGRHYGYWEDGTMKFDFLYRDDKREGVQKQWYRSGKPYAFLTFRDDQEIGMQQAWRESGRLYINYEARDGVRYGLQKSVLCNTIENGEAL